MPETFCTCGSALPKQAEFCPSCGRPLTEAALTRERVAHAAIRLEVSEPGADLPPSFGNPHAVRACYWAAAAAAIVSSLPFMLLFGFVIYPAAGFFAVRSYRRRSGVTTSEADGAKLGLMTGVMTFALFMVLLATLALGSEGLAGAAEEFAAQLEESGQAEFAASLSEMFASPVVMVSYLLSVLVLFFTLVAGFTSLGGLLGAKILEDD